MHLTVPMVAQVDRVGLAGVLCGAVVCTRVSRKHEHAGSRKHGSSCRVRHGVQSVFHLTCTISAPEYTSVNST